VLPGDVLATLGRAVAFLHRQIYALSEGFPQLPQNYLSAGNLLCLDETQK